ncbi:hypothetical protein QSV40_12660 [Enterobacter ludwigii]|uniref:hypothetical protein n=1 Tax=Enterobacter ludwigii TaxID=299767 RepID=UPI00079AFFF7|nr:hypothetical protein [Enterobacter ludwigii]MDR6399482.1 hypothetical protein [Enterobacter ludwigii]WPL51468.1 hypothetical protein QSV40_12660 [Enterobacter ludwigii]CZU85260.1 Uncharacterised protein [Enterobacter ludwigii]HDT3267827.1 hypothetical protein [Enterobacter ludwigii]
MYESMRLILLSFVFLGLFISLVLYVYFYRKHSQELTKAFHLLSSKQYLDINDYLFYEQLGLPGFAHRVFLMRRIIACKPIKPDDKKQITPEAGRCILSIYRFSWIETFYKLTIFVVMLMLLLFVLVASGR